jgi:hypothetical protein
VAKLGLDCRLYRNSAATYATPTWSEVTKARDVTLTLERGDTDVSVRGSTWRLTQGTLKEATIEFELVWEGGTPTDVNVAAFRDAFLNGTNVDIAALDGPVASPGSQGLRAECQVTSFTREEPLEDAVTISVTLKPALTANPPSWMTTP